MGSRERIHRRRRSDGNLVGPRSVQPQAWLTMGNAGVESGERNARWRQPLALLAVGVVIAAAVGLLWMVVEGSVTSTASDSATSVLAEPVPWDGGLLDGDQLTLYSTGARPAQAGDPCSAAYEAVAEPADDRMVVTVHALAGARQWPGQECDDIGYERSDRRRVQGTGRSHPATAAR